MKHIILIKDEYEKGKTFPKLSKTCFEVYMEWQKDLVKKKGAVKTVQLVDKGLFVVYEK